MSLTHYFNWIILSASLILSSCGAKKKEETSQQQRKPEILTVETFIITTRPFAEKIEVPGSIIANEATEIHPEISGRIIRLNIAEGKFAGKGALLAKLYDADLQAQLRKLQVQLKIAETNEQRSSQLLKIQGISRADYDASLLNVNNIKADIDIIRANITKTEIRAPFAGKIGLKNVSPGAYVTPATILATINQVSQLKLDFTVPEKYSSQIKIGQLVDFSFEGAKKRYKAKVTATESSVTENTRSLMVRSLVSTNDAVLLPGAFAKVYLSFDPDPNTIMIPTQAVLPQARGKQVILYNGGVASFVNVTTGVRDSANVQITEGLKAGDTIVTTGLLSIRPGSAIKAGKVTK